jgi:hypothetical protein
MSVAIATGLPPWVDTSRVRPAKVTDFRLLPDRCFLRFGHESPHNWMRIALDSPPFPGDCRQRVRVVVHSGGVNLAVGDEDGYATRELAEAWIAATVAAGTQPVLLRARRRR